MRGLNGRIWLGLAKPRGAAIDQMAEHPWMRSLTFALTQISLAGTFRRMGNVMAFDEMGKVYSIYQDPSRKYPGNHRRDRNPEKLYIQSLRMPRPLPG